MLPFKHLLDLQLISATWAHTKTAHMQVVGAFPRLAPATMNILKNNQRVFVATSNRLYYPTKLVSFQQVDMISEATEDGIIAKSLTVSRSSDHHTSRR